MSEPRAGTVYVLIDPRDNRVRYVGATIKTLKARLSGHLNSPTPRIRAWVNELAAAGLKPRIEPLNEGVPAEDLETLERAEITRRVIAGERILNQSGTAQGRHYVEEQEELARVEGERAAWERVAHQIRTALGGPIAPGDVPPFQFGQRSTEAYLAFKEAKAAIDPRASLDSDALYKRDTQLQGLQDRAQKLLWRSAQAAWSALMNSVRELFSSVLESQVRAFVTDEWDSQEEAFRYLTLLPWRLVAVTPWAALADRAGIDPATAAFIEWVTDDPTVREALTVLGKQPYGRWHRISILDHYDTNRDLSYDLVALTAPHVPEFDLPQELHSGVQGALERMLRDGQLTAAMADLLLKLDPDALNRLLGPDIASQVDARLGLRPGTARDVFVAALEASSPSWKADRLDRIVNRSRAAFPTVPAPDFRDWFGDTIPMLRAITASLVAAGILPAAPRGKTPAGLIDEVRVLWCIDPERLERAA